MADTDTDQAKSIEPEAKDAAPVETNDNTAAATLREVILFRSFNYTYGNIINVFFFY
jgi:hypothetical protein